MSFEKLAEEKIRQAMADGEFDDLAMKGKPLDLTAYFSIHEDLRMAYSILKNANIVPEELEILKEIERLQQEIKKCTDDRKKVSLERKVQEQQLKVNLLLEQERRARKSGTIK